MYSFRSWKNKQAVTIFKLDAVFEEEQVRREYDKAIHDTIGLWKLN